MRCRVARSITTALAVLTISTAAGAQQDQQQFQGVMRPVPPLPPIGLPLPSIGLPLPTIGLPRRDENARPVPTPQPPARRSRQRASPPVIALLPAYMWMFPVPVPAASGSTTKPEESAPGVGTLWLDVQPRASLQLYVDGYYVGLTDDSGGAVSLTEGPHHVELRGTGWEPQAFNVRTARDRTITYTATLAPTAAAKSGAAATSATPPIGSPAASSSEPPPPSRTPGTIYVIPGCYVGNVRPEPSKLPAGCDPAKATTLQR